MKYFFLLIIHLVSLTTYAQGIRFEQGWNWEAVLEKARQTGKPIFIDCYTTWCGPCKQMDRDVFPQKESGDFFNARFINLKLQMDQTSADTDEIKARYALAKQFEKAYQVTSFPCYLFFDASGKLIHKAGGGGMKPADLIALAGEALQPGRQLTAMKEQYAAGLREPAFMKLYTQKLAAARDTALPAVADEFIRRQNNRYSPESVNMMIFMTTGSNSPYFDELYQHKAQLYAAIGQTKGDAFLKKVIDADIMKTGFKATVDRQTGKQSYIADEPALQAYFRRFYGADSATFLAGFHTANMLKLVDVPAASRQAQKVLAAYKPLLDVQQASQLALTIAHNGSNAADNRLALTAMDAYLQTDHQFANQTLCKLYAYNGQHAVALQYAAKALAAVRKTRPDYPDITPEEYLKRTLMAGQPPKIVTSGPPAAGAEQPQQALPEQLRVGFRFIGGLMFAEASIDGTQGLLLIDTGSNGFIMLNADHFKGAATGGQIAGMGGHQQVVQVQTQLVEWAQLRLRNKVLPAFAMSQLAANPEDKILGIVGSDFFKDYQLTLNFAARELVLNSKPASATEVQGITPAIQLPFVLKNGFPVVTATIGGKPYNFVMDTGATDNLMDSSLEGEISAIWQQQGEVTMSEGSGTGGKVRRGKLERLTIGGLNMEGIGMGLNKLPAFDRELNVSGILGFQFLKYFFVEIDYPGRTMKFYDMAKVLGKQ